LYYDVQNNIEVHSIVESGLPDNSSIDIDIDSTGQPWFATPAAGLVTDLGNGGPWARWNITNSPIPTNGLTCIAINKEDQRIFMGSELFGIIIKQNDVWQSYNQQNSDLPTNHITAIVHESSHVKWIGTFNNGVVRIEETDANVLFHEVQSLQLFPTLIRVQESLYLSESVYGSLTIQDPSGRILNQQKLLNTKEIFPKIEQTGLYYLKLVIKNQSYFFKIVVI